MSSRLVAAALAGALIAASGCTSSPTSDSSQRLLVFGIDGADWDRVLPLVRQGKMPALERLMRSGTRRTLLTLAPGATGQEWLSPTIWTTAATGVRPERHGILHFVTTTDAGVTQPVTSNQRRVPALWNMLSARNRTVGVIGWLVTWPAEPVNGYLVSSYMPFIFRWNDAPAARPIKGTLVEGVPDQVWPPELEAPLEKLKVSPSEITEDELVRRFTGRALPAVRSEDLQESLDGMRWSWAADETYERIYDYLSEHPPGGRRPDLELLYFASVDVISHRFWKYMEPTSWTEEELSPEEVTDYGQSVESAYRSVDGVLERVLTREKEPVRVIVLSDHGFQENRAPTRMTSSGWHRPQGILVASGPGIPRGVTLGEGSVVDVAPTVLYALGLPVGEDFDGDPQMGLFTPDYRSTHEVKHIPSWEAEVKPTSRDTPVTSPVDDEIIERLQALGYLD